MNIYLLDDVNVFRPGLVFSSKESAEAHIISLLIKHINKNKPIYLKENGLRFSGFFQKIFVIEIDSYYICSLWYLYIVKIIETESQVEFHVISHETSLLNTGVEIVKLSYNKEFNLC